MAGPERVYFLADMHLKPLDAPNEEARALAVRDNERLARFLAHIEGRAGSLVLLGDTFNFWFERRGKIVGDYGAALALFRVAADNGLDIHHVSGNRDFVIGEGLTFNAALRYPGFFRMKRGTTVSRLTDFGIEPHGPRYRLHQAGKTFTCIHGDGLCRGDASFMLLRWLLQGPIGRTVFRYSPWLFMDSLFSRQQGRTKIRVNRKRTAALFDKETVWREFAMGGDCIVCGHIHRHHEEDHEVTGRQCRLVSLPAWLDGGYGILENGELRIEYFDRIEQRRDSGMWEK